MNSEALKLLDEYDGYAANVGGCTNGNCIISPPVGVHTNGGCTCYRDPMKAQRILRMAVVTHSKLRALLSAQEPTAEHWRRAIREEIGEVVISYDELQRIEQRARELAKQEAK